MNGFNKTLQDYQDADFYSLSEAAEYLNKKYNKFLFSDSSILKQMLAYKIPAHIYSFGLTTFGSEFIFKGDLLPRKNQKESNYDRDSMEADLTEFLRVECCETGLFLELKHKDLVQLFMQKQVITPAFQDVVPFEYVSHSANLRDVITQIWKDSVSNYVNEKLDPLIQSQISKAKLLFDNFDSVENILNDKNMQDFLFKEQYLDVKPQIINIEKNISHLKNYCFFKIITEDVIILRKNLVFLEKYLIGEEVFIQNKQILASKLLKSPTGKSKNKEAAQLAAKTLAAYFWKNDHNKDIRIKDMSIMVYAELNQTSHKIELPDRPESIKEWIKEVAPNYAREAGRPKEI